MIKKQKKSHQPPLSVAEQIENLTSLGLQFKDKDLAKKVLGSISYYRLIKAYSLTLKREGRYKDDTYFEDILELYRFDKELRYLLFSIIEEVEVMLRACITNYFSLKYGNFGYLDLNNVENKYGRYEDALQSLLKEIERRHKELFVKNFKENYEGGELPMYAALEVSSFGTLSKMLKNMKRNDKFEIANFFNIPYFYLQSWIENLAYIRNTCAHYGRLYCIKLTKTPKMYKEYNGVIQNYDLFATVLNFKYLVDERVLQSFIEKLEILFQKYPSVKIGYMGFPENWKEFLGNCKR